MQWWGIGPVRSQALQRPTTILLIQSMSAQPILGYRIVAIMGIDTAVHLDKVSVVSAEDTASKMVSTSFVTFADVIIATTF